MRSNELAALAGVSVRTLRHYHQIGLLEEPERSVNRYRRYTVHHLATLLRIARFTELGIPLSEVQRVIDDPVASRRLLAGIDAQAAAEIARLEHRRRRIAELGDGGATPDVPESLVPYAFLLARQRSTADRESRYEREQLALLAHLSDDPSLPWLVTASARLAQSSDRYLALVDRFAGLPATAGPAETEPLAVEMSALLAAAIDLDAVPELSRRGTELLVAHQRSHLNEAQHLVVDRLTEHLRASLPEPDAQR
ncbi:MerR family transcriptional regulator [Agrococcus baldri]|uniref:MerR family transcriptional regulator n=1 Tax=Agrococcus baldri TaxID=153730 RepID=A0AA87URF6_9MICO|nr:MerR family transcriptional regulator [Agrococcus baldri]GEK79678.1 MerR family transcriptional regulator [Agrococcus baldri]